MARMGPKPKPNPPKECPICKKMFVPLKPSRPQTYCSKKCSGVAGRKEKPEIDRKFKKVPKTKMGRPPDLTPETQKTICDAIRIGCYVETAATYAGVHKATLYEWLKKGAKKNGDVYHNFHDAVGRAMSECEMRDLNAIDKVATGRDGYKINWQAAAWRLSKRNALRWGDKTQIKIEGEGGEPSDTFTGESLNKVLSNLVKDIEDDRWED